MLHTSVALFQRVALRNPDDSPGTRATSGTCPLHIYEVTASKLFAAAIAELWMALLTALVFEVMKRANVAKPEPNQLIVPGVTTSIDQFLGVSDLPDEDLFAQRELYSGRVPDQLLVIAQCGGGNLICIDCQSSGAFFWDHEKEGTGEQLVLEVARIFVALRELLLPYRPGDFVSDSKSFGVSKRPGFAEKFKKFM